jgi:hypothetical protein
MHYQGEYMKSCIRAIFVIIVVLLDFCCFAYCYEIYIDDKINKKTGRRQRIIALSDYHFKKHPSNKEQRRYIKSLLKKCVEIEATLIIEDLSSVNNDGRMICCHFGVSCSEGMLGQLADKARVLGIKVNNVEYRYCRVAGVGPLLNNIEVGSHCFKSSSTIAMPSLYKEVVDEIEKIKKYNDGKFLNNLYKNAVSRVETALAEMGFDNRNVTVADYCKLLRHKQYRQELEKLCIFDSALIDMNIMHAIAMCPDEPFIFIIAGGSHIEQVNTFLKRMGYKSVLKKIAIAAPMLKKVLDSDAVHASSDIHPQPVDIAIIDKFIY